MTPGEQTADVIVIGAGIVGLATGARLLQRNPRLRLIVVEKEHAVGLHQTTHNSGVVHRGVYYAPGSLKAKLCVQGAKELLEFCDARGIRYRTCGKLVVAVEATELDRLAELERRARANGVPGAEIVGPERMAELEPAVSGLRALYSPTSAIVDFGEVASALADEIREAGGVVRLGEVVRAIHGVDARVVVETARRQLTARAAVVCAGLQSDRLAGHSRSVHDSEVRIVPFRGDYFVLKPERAELVRGLVYPVPDPQFPFLGVHLTRRVDGSVWAGPNAVPALAREGYARWSANARDAWSTLSFRGFWRMARRHWREGLGEVWRGLSKAAFTRAVQRYVPSITAGDLVPGPSGIRAQAMSADGALLDDFALRTRDRVIHVLNAPSPAATSSLAIGTLLSERVEQLLAAGAR